MSNAVSTTGILIKRQTATVSIVSSSVANPTVVTTATPHGFNTGDAGVIIAGHTGSTPALNGTYTVTRVDATHFTVPLNVTVGGTGGTAADAATYDTIAEITKVTPPGFSRNKIETSTHNDGTESYILGLLRQKDAAFTVNYLASDLTHTAMQHDILDNVKNNWQIAFPSGVTFSGVARVQQFQIADAPVDGAQQADMVLTWAGPVTQS